MQRIRNVLLTRAECVLILKNALNVPNVQLQLIDYQLERDTDAIGYLGDYYALTLRYCTAAADTPQKQLIFIKAVPQKSDELEKEAIFRKEAWLYDKLLPDMQKCSNVKWSAKCYYTRSELLALENIKLLGYSAAPAKLLQEQQVHQVVRTLAAFHASSLVYEQRRGTNIGREFGAGLREITVAANIAWFTTGLSAILAVIKSLPQYQTSEHFGSLDGLLAEITQRVYDQVSPSTKYTNVLCHRDLWAGNLFFPADETEAALLIDFQTCRYSPPAIDLCFCLYLNATPIERQRLEANCIDLYYDYLQHNLQDFGLSTLISKTELLESYNECRLVAAVYSAVVATVVHVPPAFVTNDFKYVDRSSTILDYMQENREFGDIMEKCCVEVMDTALSNL